MMIPHGNICFAPLPHIVLARKITLNSPLQAACMLLVAVSHARRVAEVLFNYL